MSRVLHLYAAASAIVAMLAAGPASAGCRMTNPDLAVADINLLDGASASRVVGSVPEIVEDGADLPHAIFTSRSGAEVLALFAGPGTMLDEYSEFEVRAAGKEALALKDLPIAAFTTAHGVGLGLSPNEITGRFGTCYKARERSGEMEIIQYELPIDALPADLSRRGFHDYFAEYEFENGKLVRFRFGLEEEVPAP